MLPKPLQNLIDSFSRLPSIGPKTAERLSFYLLKETDQNIKLFAQALSSLKSNLFFCTTCFNIDEKSPCRICEDDKRNKNIICVLENPLDLISIEKSGIFKGQYHVLNGVLSPIDGIGPNDLKINELIARIDKNTQEIILALNPSMEGEATSQYIKSKIDTLGLKVQVTRIARGLPTGSNIEYADEVTIQNALEGRRNL